MTTAEILALVILNTLAWLLIHLAVSAIGTRLPAAWFQPNSRWFRPRSWERNGRLYEQRFRIRHWKDAVPDGAAWFSRGFPKGTLHRRDPDYLSRFVLETCRGEMVHVATCLCALPFFLWNPAWAGVVMIGYGLGANLPCILIQRYNRIRLLRTLNPTGFT